jgi:hypothetical protein
MLDEQEWIQAVTAYPELNSDDELLNYFPRSANAWIEPKKDNYFDNSIILRQFERLLKLIKFKKSYVDNQIVILVDNARTHTCKVYDINLMNKSPGTNCPYEKLEWKEDGMSFSVDLFDKDGKSKGLFSLAKELKLIPQDALPKEFKLDRLREIFSQHPSFQISSKLEQLTTENKAFIIWCPKFHCELNPIEGFWCFLKAYVRRNNDQNFSTFLPLINTSIEKYQESGIHVKLWKRFWDCIEMYESGSSYQDELQSLFGAKNTVNVQHHKNIKHFNTNLK